MYPFLYFTVQKIYFDFIRLCWFGMLLSFWFNILNKTGFSASRKSDRFRFKLESLGCTLRFKSGIIVILFPSFLSLETKLKFYDILKFWEERNISQFYLELLRTVQKFAYFSKSLAFPEYMNFISKDTKGDFHLTFVKDPSFQMSYPKFLS